MSPPVHFGFGSSGGSGGNTFGTIQPDFGTSIAADSSNDTAIFTSSDGSVRTDGTAATDTLDFTVPLLDPSKVLYGYWDFDGYAQNLASTDVGWANVASGSGATCVVNGGFSLDSTHPGNVRFQTGTTTTGYTGIFRGQCYTMGVGEFVYEALVYLANLSDGTDTYVFMLGTGADFTATTDFTSGIYFRYTHGSSSGNWELKTAAAGSRTTRDTGVAATAGAWTKLKYVVNAAGTSVQAYVNGSAAGAAITTNIPTANASGLNVHLEKTAGTTNRITYLDYVKVRLTFTTAR